MRVLVPKELKSGEKRVALVPDIISKLTRAGLTVAIESGAGTDSQATDSEFQAAGAEIIATSNIQSELGKADVVASTNVALTYTSVSPAYSLTCTINFTSTTGHKKGDFWVVNCRSFSGVNIFNQPKFSFRL